MLSSAEEYSLSLLRCGAVLLRPHEPFRWAAGWLSPIYTDNRRTLAFPDVRQQTTAALLALVRRHFPAVSAVAAVATGAIAQGALLAAALAVPLCYVRAKAKDHGTGSLVEGFLPQDSKVVVVEDLISTGASSLRAVAALRGEGYDVVGMVASYTYGFAVAADAFRAAQVPLYTVSDYATTLAVAVREGFLSAADVALLEAWRAAPATWQPQQ